MNKSTYKLIEDYMLSCMEDSAHDKEHIYRVLYNALDIASYETNVDYDVLICACLLYRIFITVCLMRFRLLIIMA